MTVVRLAPRRRDAARTRAALLESAKTLFGERGYEGTTVREVAERAGVDPTLIARYFGSKAALYVETLQSDTAPADLLDPQRLAALLDRVARVGAGPVLQVAIRPHGDDEIQRASTQALHDRLVTPLRDRLAADAGDLPPGDHSHSDVQLRAEVAVAAFAGIALAVSSGAFPALAAATAEELVAVTAAVLRGVRAPD
ncbi:MAG: hypothetical protein JWM93_1334 [Frankiales bacterium]|nr:hypothetical protein [Frankiales bacterium]